MPDEIDTTDTTGAVPAPPKTDGVLQISQEELGRRMTAEKAQGRRSANAELAKELGFDSLDALKSAVKAKQDAEREAMSAAERAQADAKAAQDEAARLRAEAASERHAALAERLLARAGAQSTDRVVRLLDAEVGASEKDVQAAVNKLKNEMPALFSAAPTGGPIGTGDTGRPPAGGSRDAASKPGEAGRAAAERMFGRKAS